jgi:hypothetical protein
MGKQNKPIMLMAISQRSHGPQKLPQSMAWPKCCLMANNCQRYGKLSPYPNNPTDFPPTKKKKKKKKKFKLIIM